MLGYGCLVLLLLQVVFSYNPLIGQPVLKGVSFTAPGGKTLAIVGSTGSGKSSLLRYEGCRM
jgi:ABC-type multidrug transport system fused ATPase/permease subunit